MTARDVATGKAQSIHISGSTRLPEAEKQRMIKHAERYAEEDRRRREQADKLNNADAICYQGERFLADFGDKVAAEACARIDNHIKDINAAIAKRDADGATAHAETEKSAAGSRGRDLPASRGPAAEWRPGRGRGTARRRRDTARGVVDAEYRETRP